MISILQIVFVAALCIGAAWWLGVLYAMMAALVCCIALAMFYARERAFDREIDGIRLEHPRESYAIGFFYRLVLAIFLGLVWPSLPVILGAGRIERERVN